MGGNCTKTGVEMGIQSMQPFAEDGASRSMLKIATAGFRFFLPLTSLF
jgi:hypothetical protein